MVAVTISALLLLAGLAQRAESSAFLSAQSHLGGGKRLLSKSTVEDLLVSELGPERERHVLKLEEELRPLFTAMPKNEHGNLEPSVTRYALHRYFAQTYGWYVVGLEPAGGSFNSSSPGNIMKDRVPAYIESLFEQRLQGKGLGIREVAVFAATLLDLIHKESIDDLHAVYDHHGADPSQTLSDSLMDQVTHAYVLLYFHSFDTSSNASMNLRKMEKELEEEFVIWPDVAMWARDLRGSFHAEQARRNSFVDPGSFDKVAEYAQELGHHFGSFQNLECQSLKGQLMDMEYRGTGRVRLSEFYSGADDESWTFTESVDYLRALGALDETDPNKMSVIIPNFVMSPTNCVTPSNLYSACCLNECEGLMSSLERAIGGPTAEPSRIAELVSALASDTVDAPRTIPAAQIQRLGEIAELHGGAVPLHGRLFAQWMHHAYPRECPYPHVAGATSPVSPDEWMKTAASTEASEREMAKHRTQKVEPEELEAAMTPEAKAEALPWITVEELVITPPQRAREEGSGMLRLVGMLALAASLLQVKRSSRSAWFLFEGQSEKGNAEKHFV